VVVLEKEAQSAALRANEILFECVRFLESMFFPTTTTTTKTDVTITPPTTKASTTTTTTTNTKAPHPFGNLLS
jgi:hypothetical protein